MRSDEVGGARSETDLESGINIILFGAHRMQPEWNLVWQNQQNDVPTAAHLGGEGPEEEICEVAREGTSLRGR